MRLLFTLLLALPAFAQFGSNARTLVRMPPCSGTFTTGCIPSADTVGNHVGPTVAPIQSATHRAFGDSITYGAGATVPANQYTNLLAAGEGTVMTDRGIPGALACDMGDLQIFANENPAATANPIYTVLIGTNDANTKGTGSYEAVFNTCHQAALAWLAIPRSTKVLGQDAACVASGTWVNDDTYQTGIGIKSTTIASALACTITTTGGNLYAWYRIIDSNGGTFTYSLDGGTAVSATASTTPAIAAQNGGTQGVALIRIPGVASGSHTLTFTVTSATNAGNVVSILGVGTVSGLRQFQAPRVFVGGVVRQASDTKASTTAAYDADAKANVTLLASDGLFVKFVDVRAYINIATDMFDGLHPNDTGHGHLRDAFAAVEQYTPSASNLFSLPIKVSTGVPANPAGYSQMNSGNLLSTSALNPGITVFGATPNFFGADLGHDSQYFLRLFTSESYTTKICFYHAGVAPTAQSSFYLCPYIFDSTGYLKTTGFQSTAVAFSALPSCVAGLEGTMAAVTDSTTITFGATITGSGSNHVLAYCDGTNWTVH